MEIHLDDATLANLVSNVTGSMLGIPFVVSDTPTSSHVGEPQVAMIPITGKPALLVALSSDAEGCQVLGATMFAMPHGTLDPSLVADALSELVNMTAGQIKNALAKRDESLGLPQVLPAGAQALASTRWRTVRLRGGPVELVLWLGTQET